MPPQWRDPCISSLLLLLHLPFLNQPQKLGCPIHVAASRDMGGNVHPHPASSCFCRWLFFVSVVAFVCQFYVVILSAAKNPRISEGSVATRMPFFSTTNTPSFRPKRLTALREPRSGETRFSTHPASQPKPRLCLCSLLPTPYSLLPVFLDCITTSAPAVGCGVSSGVSVKASAPAWRKEPTS